MIKKLDMAPISGEYEEKIFDIPGPWREIIWPYVKFTTNEGNEWCGSFRAKDYDNFLIAELKSKGIACIISGGHGYIININKKEKLKDLDNEYIISLIADDSTNSFIISDYWTIYKVDELLKEIPIELPISTDGIYFKGIVNNKLNMEIEEVGPDVVKSNDYYLDLTDWSINKYK